MNPSLKPSSYRSHSSLSSDREKVSLRSDPIHDRTFRIVTLGCKVNQYESAYIFESLCRAGWRAATSTERADLTIVNTCIVTQKASHQSRQAIRKALKENLEGFVAAIGCYAQVFPQELARIDGISLIAGNTVKKDIPRLIEEVVITGKGRIVNKDFSQDMPFDFMPVSCMPGRSRAFLKIQDGCQAFCTYCIVPYARGPYRSLEPRLVLSSLHTLAERGFKEVVLTGIHVGKYGVDLHPATSFKELLVLIVKEGLPLRIRISSIEPHEVDPDLIGIVANEKMICKHFHIPLQSGDPKILKRMNRRYTPEQFARTIEEIHGEIPVAAIGVDIMSGFPGETEIEHMNTLRLLEDLPISHFHIFPFSRREGTPAYGFKGQVPPEVVKKRLAMLRELAVRKKQSFYSRSIGNKFVTIAEKSLQGGLVKGTTDNYIPVLFPRKEGINNRMVTVKIEKVEGDEVHGKIVQ